MRYTSGVIILWTSAIILNFLIFNPVDSIFIQARLMILIMIVVCFTAKRMSLIQGLMCVAYFLLILVTVFTGHMLNDYISKSVFWVVTNTCLYLLSPDPEVTELGDDVLDGDVSIIDEIKKGGKNENKIDRK